MAYSESVIRAYMSRYATERRLGRTVTNEDIARIHNGGPNGWNNSNTQGYWDKVSNQLNKRCAGKDNGMHVQYTSTDLEEGLA